MTEYLVPTRDGESEFTEKRSRFIGHIKKVETEEEARAFIASMKARYHDARHNCWCYLLREGGVLRYSDDGEPQGTAGQPMLEVFRREEVVDLCCVVTRYFGGVLLGAGGLVRAYARSAKETLDQVGVSVVRRWVEVVVDCPYPLLERLKLEVEGCRGVLGELEYGASVGLHALLPEEGVEAFAARVQEVTAGQIAPQILGESFRAVPI